MRKPTVVEIMTCMASCYDKKYIFIFIIRNDHATENSEERSFSHLNDLSSMFLPFKCMPLVITAFPYFAWTSNGGITILDIIEQAGEEGSGNEQF